MTREQSLKPREGAASPRLKQRGIVFSGGAGTASTKALRQAPLQGAGERLSEVEPVNCFQFSFGEEQSLGVTLRSPVSWGWG